ncbi:VOC family protein [Bacteriovorax sp. DB6_IX]|uniref:VOC family protein n=1 Tax=Bacteriovorax sp. DB6_IX TaxID=1353530 RepID=UPI00038A3AA6|nr:VOC family protein [Bacteriovorax sp. DB6_IX]EQC52621.1 glyoxalase-like domain protein [Bacteriovorax sp. DB6_IX]
MELAKKSYDGALTCALSVKDLNKAIDWYNKVLGFETLYVINDQGWAELSTSVNKVNIGLSVKDKITVGGGAILTWGVLDIESFYQHLQEHHVKFDGEVITIPEMVKILTFYDLDGNALMVAQDLTN